MNKRNRSRARSTRGMSGENFPTPRRREFCDASLSYSVDLQIDRIRSFVEFARFEDSGVKHDEICICD